MAATALYYNNHTDVETGYGAAPVYQAEGTHNNAYPSQTSVVNQRKSDNKVCIFITIGVIAAILILVVIPVIVVLVCCCCIIDEATDIAKDYDYCVKNPKDKQCTMWQPTYDLAYCSNTQHKNETGCQQLYKFCADNDKKNPKPAGWVNKCQGGAPISTTTAKPGVITTTGTVVTTAHGQTVDCGSNTDPTCLAICNFSKHQECRDDQGRLNLWTQGQDTTKNCQKTLFESNASNYSGFEETVDGSGAVEFDVGNVQCNIPCKTIGGNLVDGACSHS